MILPPVSDTTRRRRSLRIAIGVWLLFISLLALVNSVGLSRLAGDVRRDTQTTQIKALSGQVAELTQQAEAGKRQPTPASQAEVAAARQALEARLEQAQAAAVPASDMQALQNRVSAIEHREQAIKATPVPRHPRSPVAARPRLSVPPFRIVGIELRGGERFLSIAAPDATSLASIRLLREGDSDNGWQLQSIDAHAALFVVKGQTQRVALP